MVRTIFWYMYFWLFQLASLPILLVYFLLALLGLNAIQGKILYRLSRFWAQQMVGAAGARVEVTGLDNMPEGGGVLFVSNHQGAFDIPLLIGFIPGLKGFVSKKENFRLPIVGIWMRLLGCIILDRRNLRQSARAFGRGVRALRANKSLIIFPEGTRSQSAAMSRFKDGSFKLATRSGAAIVPVTIDGTYRLLETNRGRIVPGKVHLHIHPAIFHAKMGDAEKKALTETVQRIIASRLSLNRPA